MSAPREILFTKVKQWTEYAEDDLRAAKQSLKASPPLKRIAAFHAQQSAEKYLKALLIRHEIDFPLTHNLSILLELSSKWLNEDQELDEAISLNVYAVMMRYPGVADDLTEKEVEAAIKIATP